MRGYLFMKARERTWKEKRRRNKKRKRLLAENFKKRDTQRKEKI